MPATDSAVSRPIQVPALGPAGPVNALADHPAAGRPHTLAAAVEPLLVGRRDAARIAGVSRATWDRLTAAGRTPAPVRLGGRTLWRVEDLRRWVELGCPSRREYDVLRDGSAQHGGGPQRRPRLVDESPAWRS
jgi:predicted DNA-binding transcriptional regulator AlpA